MKGKTCAVVGGAGFIGHHIVNQLIKEGANVRIIDDLSSGNMKRVPEGSMFFKIDIGLPQSATSLEAAFNGVDYVFHLAAKISVPESIADPVGYSRTNVQGMQHVMEAARKAGVKRVVFSSSSAVYGDTDVVPTTEKEAPNPKSPYALHKLYGEHLCKLYSKIYDLETVCLRYFNVYGIGNRHKGAYAPVIALFVQQYYDEELLTVCGDGKQTRDFIHVDDVVRANIAAALSRKCGNAETLNVGTGIETSVLRLVELFGKEATFLPARLEPKFSRADISLTQSLLDWSPTKTVEEGVHFFMTHRAAIFM